MKWTVGKSINHVKVGFTLFQYGGICVLNQISEVLLTFAFQFEIFELETNLQTQFDQSRHNESNTGKYATHYEPLKWFLQNSEFAKKWINSSIKDGNKNQDQSWIEDLKLIRLDDPAPRVSIHSCSLERPPRSLLIEERYFFK